MEEAGGVGDPLIGDGNRESAVAKTISWPFVAHEVSVCIWDGNNWSWFQLARNEHLHSVQLRLMPSVYWFFYHVDGTDRHNPYLSWESRETGNKLNYICVKGHGLDNKYESREGFPITYKHFKSCGSVYVTGSWDTSKQWCEMIESRQNHVKLLWLYPGRYRMKFHVDGKVYIHQGIDIDYERDSDGEFANIVNVVADPQFHELHGNTSAALLDDFMALPENEVSVVVKFMAGSKCGSILPEDKACPCTEIGYMLLNGFIRCFKEEYMRGYSWAGCFKPSDMVVVDGKHCQMRKRATKALKRLNFLLDVYQLKECLLLKYKKDDLLPPYFTSLFVFLEDPPEDFDSNKASRDHYFSFFDNQAALATPPERMLSLVNMGQFFKQLPEEHKSKFAMKFNQILKFTSDWQAKTLQDKFLKNVFEAKRKVENGQLVKRVPNTSLEATYSLRILFVHGPEHTFDNEVQILTDFAEIDLIVAHHFNRLLADFLFCVHDNMHEHVLIKAMWDFYCGGAPPDHLQLELWSPPAAPPA